MQIFISYCREDMKAAARLVDDLRSNGIECWFDQEDLSPGTRWKHHTETAIWESAYFLVLLSNRWIDKKGFVQKELRLALERAEELPFGTRFIIPVRLDNCESPHPALQDSQRVDLFSSYKKGVKQLTDLFAPPCGEVWSAKARAISAVSKASSRIFRDTDNLLSSSSDHETYVGPKIEGLWLAEITFPQGEKNWHKWRLRRKGHSIFGRSLCYKGYSKGISYDLAGTFECPILTCIYRIVDSDRLEKGSMTLMLLQDGMTLKGHLLYYDSESNSIEGTDCRWSKEKRATGQ